MVIRLVTRREAISSGSAGDPSRRDLNGLRYDTANCETMIFNVKSRAAADHGHAARLMLSG